MPPRERLDVVLSVGARSFARGGLGLRRDIPDGSHHVPVNVSQLGDRDELAGCPLPRLDGVAVDPISGSGVAADLEVLAQLLVPDRAALSEQCLDLFEHQGLSLDRRRVVRLFQPDPAPDAVSWRS